MLQCASKLAGLYEVQWTTAAGEIGGQSSSFFADCQSTIQQIYTGHYVQKVECGNFQIIEKKTQCVQSIYISLVLHELFSHGPVVMALTFCPFWICPACRMNSSPSSGSVSPFSLTQEKTHNQISNNVSHSILFGPFDTHFLLFCFLMSCTWLITWHLHKYINPSEILGFSSLLRMTWKNKSIMALTFEVNSSLRCQTEEVPTWRCQESPAQKTSHRELLSQEEKH